MKPIGQKPLEFSHPVVTGFYVCGGCMAFGAVRILTHTVRSLSHFFAAKVSDTAHEKMHRQKAMRSFKQIKHGFFELIPLGGAIFTLRYYASDSQRRIAGASSKRMPSGSSGLSGSFGPSVDLSGFDPQALIAGPGQERTQPLVYVADTSKRLCLMKGNITHDHGVPCEAVVNAANNQLYWGGGGTNRALSSIFPQDEWEECARKFFTASHPRLNVSEIAPFAWPQIAAKRGDIQPKFLIHALGPVIGSHPSARDLERHKAQVKLAYKNVFAYCMQEGITSVRIPLISAAIYARGIADPRKRASWLQKVNEAAHEAVIEEYQSATSTLKDITLVDYQSMPWEGSVAKSD